MRRAIVRDRVERRLIRLAICGLIVCAVIMCFVQIRRSSFSAAVGGLLAESRMGVGAGAVTLVRRMGDPAAILDGRAQPSGRWSVDFDPGCVLAYEHAVQNSGGVRTESRVVPIAAPMFVVSAGLLVLLVPLVRVPEGECPCGYSLDGLATATCPECGEVLGGSRGGMAHRTSGRTSGRAGDG